METRFQAGHLLSERYQLLEYLAQGGMGEVWKAKDGILERVVAIKLLPQGMVDSNPTALAHLRDEAKANAQLIGSPYIVTLLDFGMHMQGTEFIHYLVMEYVEGVSVETWITEPSPAGTEPQLEYLLSLYIGWGLCEGLERAHTHGLIHRDIKPSNVFLDKNRGFIKLGDFGLARFIDAATRPYTLARAGSPAYSSPEQWMGDKTSKKTDCYQLGCTLYHIFAKQLPFSGGIHEVVQGHIEELPESIPHIPTELDRLLLGLMQKKPKDRFDIKEAKDQLASFLMPYRYLHLSNLQMSSVLEFVHPFFSEVTPQQLQDNPIIEYARWTDCLAVAMRLLLSGFSAFRVEATPQA